MVPPHVTLGYWPTAEAGNSCSRCRCSFRSKTGGDRPGLGLRDALKRNMGSFFDHSHVMRVGVNQPAWTGCHGHVPFPEYQVAALERFLGLQPLARHLLLLIAVCRASDTAGAKCGLQKPRAIKPKHGIASPKIGSTQKLAGHLHRVVKEILRPPAVGCRNECCALAKSDFAPGVCVVADQLKPSGQVKVQKRD